MSRYKHSISGCSLKPTRLALELLEALVDKGVEGMSLKSLSDLTDIPRASVHRYLQILVDSGWVETIGEKNAMLWKPSKHFIQLAFNYRNAVRAEVDRIGAEFKELTGEDL
ncbi:MULTISPECIES: helix-turn-helix domain-containing protein [Vibrio]|uniref:helix-turn-helix domain-containing protein n=1 Tax=Vibrio TaxID=662 RepID=UPI00069B62F0|nr:helix-turn-helix domain-containing protein [Vibrio vulnificus]AWG86568.1 IclR family transcriptional regulator [Vibrio parahaemolyticus]EJB8688025.1 helix-turn-helix domain-containing protein [Vibrio parahaemolyticus]HAS6097486.1 helix-turn-helix domain-containing protein [Vibrio vulnificus]HDY7906119.1 helix-turn-helix domain-containing protein [Vibrio vulnificus]HDY7928876.1 helix-turn-helix domain-containing protein [Vibrio vulnificus]